MNTLPQRKDDTVKFDLAEEVLRSSGMLRLQVNGWSMLPAVWPGDILMIQRASFDDVSVGDMVLFRCDGRFFVHRVVSRDIPAFTLQTRGDSMPGPDPIVENRNLLGKVTHRLEKGTWTKMRQAKRWYEVALASVLRRSIFATRVAIAINGVVRDRNQNRSGLAIPCHS